MHNEIRKKLNGGADKSDTYKHSYRLDNKTFFAAKSHDASMVPSYIESFRDSMKKRHETEGDLFVTQMLLA